MATSEPGRVRPHRSTTSIVVLGCLGVSLGLTALGNVEAQANNPREPSRLGQNEPSGELRVLDWTLWRVSKYYVEPGRVNPAAMTLAALEALEASIPEVLVEPVGQGTVRVRVGTAEREFSSDVTALWAVGPHVREVVRFVAENTKLDAETMTEIEYEIIEGVLGTLDPHTNLLRPDQFQDMRTSTTGHFGGLGIEVGMRDGQITVLRVLDGNPAAGVGMQSGDRIVQIDEASTVTMSINEAVNLMRGAAGTMCEVYVRREGLERPKKFTITRAVITLDSVVGDVLPGTDAKGRPTKVGLVQIPRNFAQTTGKELRAKLDEFAQAGVSGVVLDMRDNPGGLLTAAVEVADAFLSSGTIVSTVGASSPRDESRADDRYDFPNLPLVVLVDQGSASATEIVAGALRNLDRAVIVGQRTFGKGSVQVLHDRRVGDTELALKLTIAQYLTPGDLSIQSVGVSPDLETIPVYVGKEMVAYFGRTRFDFVREEALAAHLVHGTAAQQQIAAGPLYFLQQGSIGETPAPVDASATPEAKRVQLLLSDPEIRIAHDLVVNSPSPLRADMLATLDSFVRDQSAREDARLATSLERRGIDWRLGESSQGSTPATPPARAELSVKVSSDRPGDVIKGGEFGTITVSVTNVGLAPAWRVRAISDSDYGYFDEREFLFGRVDPGQTKTATTKLSVAEHELSRTDRMEIHLSDAEKSPIKADSKTWIDLGAEGIARPKFALGYQILDATGAGPNVTGNGDGVPQLGERVLLRAFIENTGDGKAVEPWMHVRNASGDAVFLHTGREKVSPLQPGDSAEVVFDVEIRKPPENGEIKLQLSVSDNKTGEILAETIEFPLQDPELQWTTRNGSLSSVERIDILAAPGGPRIGRAEPGTAFRAEASAPGWVRVGFGKSMHGFVRDSQVVEKAGRTKTPEQLFSISPPRISVVAVQNQTDGETAHIAGTATDEEAVRDLYITVYNPSRNLFGHEEKVFYQASRSPSDGRLDFAADVPLTPGNNLVEIHVRENDDVIGTHRLWIQRTSGLAEARKLEQKLHASGTLRVDTLAPK